MSELPPTRLRLGEAVPLATALAAHLATQLDVRALVIKGPVAELQGLRDPRVSLDVDVLVEPAGASRFVAGLRELGWHDRPGYRALPLAGGHAATLIHDDWPCDFDVHYYWPGFARPAHVVFETLWSRRERVVVAGHGVDAPDRVDALLILMLHALRGAERPDDARDFSRILSTARSVLDDAGRIRLFEVAAELGATATAAPFLGALGFTEVLDADSEEAVLWRLRGEVRAGTANWLIELRRAPWHRRPRILAEAVFPPPKRIRMLHPEARLGTRALVVTWWRRLRRGVGALPHARRELSALRRTGHR